MLKLQPENSYQDNFIVVKILIAIHRYSAGGAERQASYLANYLAGKGYDVSVIGFGKLNDEVHGWFNQPGVTCHETVFTEKVLTNSTGIMGTIRQWLYKLRFISIIRKIAPDIIISYTFISNLLYALHWKQMKASEFWWNQRDEGRYFSEHPQSVHALNNSSRIISNSLEGYEFLRKYTSKKINVIHNGIYVPKSLSKPGAVHDEIKVIMVANLHRFKDHKTLIKAWSLLNKNSGAVGAKLYLAGKKGDTYSELCDLAKTDKIEDEVVFLGEVKDINSLLTGAHVFVFSSYKEGLPNAVLEAMAVGLPVIATKITGTIEALGEDYGFFFEKEDVSELADKLAILLRDGELRASLGKINRERVKKMFAPESKLALYENLISEMSRKGQPGHA